MKKIVFVLFLLFILGNFTFAYSKEIREEFPVPPPPLSEGIFPCSNCHSSMEVNAKKRILRDEHVNIQLRH